MKQIGTKCKIAIVILAVLLIAGITVIATMGFNIDLRYADVKKVEFNINKEFNTSDIKQITDEVLGSQEVIIQKVEVYEDSVQITTKEITEEQKEQLVAKINEKYETELEKDDIDIITVSHVKVRDIIKPYIIPFAIATGIILLYMIIRYRKLNIWKVILKTVGIIILAQAELASIIAITRIPIGRLTMPMVIVVYMLTLIGLTTRFEKNLEEIKEDDFGDGGKK